ncbi:MAG: hypothetical protein AAGI23_21485 [Bacteroidota bacterium]
MTTHQLIAKIDELAFEGKDYDEIKAYVKQMTKDEEVLKPALIHIDRALIDYAMAKRERGKTVQQMLLGGTLLLLGIIFTVFTYFKLEQQGYFYVWIGAIVSGALRYSPSIGQEKGLNKVRKRVKIGMIRTVIRSTIFS